MRHAIRRKATPAGEAAPRRTPEDSLSRPQEAPKHHGLGYRSHELGADALGTIGSAAVLLARLVRSVAILIALLIALAILLRDVDANAANTIVKGIHEGANFFAGAFTGLIAFHGHPKRAITVDWGIALLAYLLVGGLLARFIARVGGGGIRFAHSHRAAPSH